ncbi:hypothetical protein [Streptomyces sp. NPDC048659]|uniref:hypothetical protein n=1 Tax=Streptomyces sp. NPDC048659 TaxID=3155489 RepID=UPI00343E8FD7
MPVLAGAMAVAVLSAFFGGARIALPSIGEASLTTGIPYRHLLPLFSAVFLTAALGGAMSAHEETAGRTAHRVRAAYGAGLTSVVCAVSFGAEALAVGPAQGAVFVRSLLIWLGLALLSLRALGPQLAWAAPLASALLLAWYPLGWWDWTSNPASDASSWTAAVLALALGVAATAATPWRRHTLRHGRRR